jgi:hypothetical protein
VVLGVTEAAQHRLEQARRQDASDARHQPHDEPRPRQLGDRGRGALGRQHLRRARAGHLDQEVRRLQHRGLDEVDRAGGGVAAGEATPPTVVAGAPHRERFEIGPERQRRAAQLGPAEDRHRMIGRERQQRRQAVGRAVVAHGSLGVPCRVRRIGRRQHLGAQPPQRRPFGMVVQQPPAGDDEGGRVVVELAEAVGGLGDQEPVVAAMAGDGPESFERLHCLPTLPAVAERGTGAYGGECGVEATEEVRPARQHLRPPPDLQRAAREGVLRVHAALVEVARGDSIGHEHEIGRLSRGARRRAHRRPARTDADAVDDVDRRVVVHDLLHDERRVDREVVGGPGCRIELGDPRRRQELRHPGGWYSSTPPAAAGVARLPQR